MEPLKPGETSGVFLECRLVNGCVGEITGQMHSYLVYRKFNSNGDVIEESVISSGDTLDEDGNSKSFDEPVDFFVNNPLKDSDVAYKDWETPETRHFTEINTGSYTAEEIWENMVSIALEAELEAVDFDIVTDSDYVRVIVCNSLTGTVLSNVGFSLDEVLPLGVPRSQLFGYDTNLLNPDVSFDEIEDNIEKDYTGLITNMLIKPLILP